MGTTADKLNYLIERKKQLVNFIKSTTSSYNTYSAATISSSAKYSDYTWDKLLRHMQCYFPKGYVEVLFVRHYNGVSGLSSNTTYYTDYVYRGVYVSSSSRDGTGTYTITLTAYTTAYLNSYELYPYVIGSHRGTSFNDTAYATCMATSHSSGSSVTVKIYTADDSSCNDGSFTLILFGIKY